MQVKIFSSDITYLEDFMILVNIKKAAFITLTAVMTLLVSVAAVSATGYQSKFRYIITVDNIKSPYELAYHTNWLSQQGYDVAGQNWRKGRIEVITDNRGVENLKTNHYVGSKLMGQMSEVEPLALDARYLNPAKVEEKLKALNAKFPQFTTLKQIGTSGQGRAIWALLVSTTPNVETQEYLNKPSIIFDGMHHAREVMTSEVVMDVAEHALDQLDTNGEKSALLANWNVWVVPMLNVDGNNIVWTSNNMWRKNARSDGGSVYGVDLNRNYAFNWNRCSGSSGSLRNDTYRGPNAGSELETQALMNFAKFVVPTGSLSYHSYSELVLYPYGCNGVLTGENALISSVANEIASVLPTDSSATQFYTPGSPWQLLYSVDGDSMSFMFGEFGALALTFEINQSFQPSYDIKAATVTKHRVAWDRFLNRMTQNLLTLKIVDGRTNAPITAQIGISNIQLAQGEKPYRANSGGVFFKVLDPGTYTLTVQLADGRMQTVTVTMSGQPQVQTLVMN